MSTFSPLRAAQQLLDERSIRSSVFEAADLDGFVDPAWDMLLHLFVAGENGLAVSAEQLIADTEGPRETIATHLRWLETRELVAVDNGYARIGERGRDRMNRFLELWGKAR